MTSPKVICFVLILELFWWKFQQGGQSPLAMLTTVMLSARITGRVISLCFPTAERGRRRSTQLSVAGYLFLILRKRRSITLIKLITSIGRAQKYVHVIPKAMCCYSRLPDVIPLNSGVKSFCSSCVKFACLPRTPPSTPPPEGGTGSSQSYPSSSRPPDGQISYGQPFPMELVGSRRLVGGRR